MAHKRFPYVSFLALIVLIGCATFTPGPSAKTLIKAIDDRVANIIMEFLDKAKPNFVDPWDYGDYFEACAYVIDSKAKKPNPPQLDVVAAVSEVRTIAYSPDALAAVLECVDFYTPQTDPRDSAAVLQEIAQQIKSGCPGGFPPWYSPKPEPKKAKRHE